MDILKAEIAKKRKELEASDLVGPQKKYFKRGELNAKEQEKYRKAYCNTNEVSDTSSAVNEGEKSVQDVKHHTLPRNEVILKLRDRGEPILVFGETEIDAFKRLRKCELLEPEVNKGFRNDLQEAMEQVDQAYINELLEQSENSDEFSKGENKTQDSILSHEEIREMSKRMGRGNREHDMTVIVHFIQVDKNTTMEIIKKYIVRKIPQSEKLKTIGNTNSFKVGVDSKYQVNINDPGFWPHGIVFRRFNFKKPGSPGASVNTYFQTAADNLEN